MADVRLTATNPEDSSVVPVACNEKGELKLEEPIIVEGPPGAPGEQGPPGEKGEDGDPFSGNFTGDVSFDGEVGIGTTEPSHKLDVESSSSDLLRLAIRADDELPANILLQGSNRDGNSSNQTVLTSYDLGSRDSAADTAFGINVRNDGDAFGFPNRVATFTGPGNVGIGTENPKTRLDVEGKAGFTEEGYLWCTTRRGDTVILDATSQGMGIWESYTPPARELADEIRDQLGDGPTTDIDSLRPKGD